MIRRDVIAGVLAAVWLTAAAPPPQCPPAKHVKHVRLASGETAAPGKRAHTNVEVVTPSGAPPQPPPPSLYNGSAPQKAPPPKGCR